MNTQSEIKSRCQELLKEQEMSRREIRKFISKATDPINWLKAWGWTYTHDIYWDYWSKIFILPYPLLVSSNKEVFFQRQMFIQFYFSYQQLGLRITSYPPCKIAQYYLLDRVSLRKSRLRSSSILQKFAPELSKIIASAKTKLFYDKAKGKQVEVIPFLELRAKIKQAFEEACKSFEAESS